MPAYDRVLHNPVCDAITVDADNCLVLIEGLFVLLDAFGFHVRPLLDVSVFLHINETTCCQRAVRRKACTNSISKEEALAHYRRVDGPNYNVIAMCKDAADVCISLSSSQEDHDIDEVIVKDRAELLAAVT